jgi:hypothetical protein
MMAFCASTATVSSDAPRVNRQVNLDKARMGYAFLRQLRLGKAVMKRSQFDELYRAWDGDDADRAKNASPELRRKLAYSRYGFVEAPYKNYGLPMGLTYNPETKHVHINCLLCHGGSIRGMTFPGLPNQRLDLATLWEDLVVLAKIEHGQQVPQRPLDKSEHNSRTRGGSNVWIKEAELLEGRMPDLSPRTPTSSDATPFDTTPSPFWHIRKKTRLYHAGFINFGPRPPMLAVLYDEELSAESIKKLLPNFQNVAHWLDSVRAPKYPGPINHSLAARGKIFFEKACSGCHGTYGRSWTFPNRDIPIVMVGTDPVDLNGKGSLIKNYYSSWFNDFGVIDSLASLERQTYLAPPLDGIWASAPYLHNGSVPTLYHILHPDQRPRVWKVTNYDSYDDCRVGLVVHQFDSVPRLPTITASDKRRYFDTSIYGQSNAGHLFSNHLTIDEKDAVLEYLKTL